MRLMSVAARSVSITVLLAWPCAAPASAQGVIFALQNFRPAVNPTRFFVTETGQPIPHLAVAAGPLVNYAHRPLRLVGEGLDRDLVSYQAAINLLIGVGFWDRLEIGLDLPATVGQSTEDLSALGRPNQDLSPGLGDVRITPKGRLVTTGPFTLSLAAGFSLPSGSKDSLLGEDSATFAPQVIAAVDFTRVSAAFNIGYRLRKDHTFVSPGGVQTVALADQVPMSIGGRWNVWKALDLVGDLYWTIGVKEQDEEEVPLELLAGARYRFPYNLVGTLGLGGGLTAGVGTPAVRVLAGLAVIPGWEKPRPPPPAVDLDPDRDGILGAADKCPNDPEDKDGFEDQDGCPEPDNDRDGIFDAQDKCPNDAEDRDGFEDEDGCPEPDNDRDGILDAQDKCPNEPEDRDGFEDEDGCPDPDNDKDGIPDAQDKCPNEAEVFNGFEDADGCPDKAAGPIQIEKGRITVPTVYFATARDVVLKRSLATLRQVADLLQRNPWVRKIRIEGHTDDRGKDAFNLDLSERRARSVMKWLIEYGVDPGRIEAKGYGETQPIASNKTAKGRSANRRVDFIITDPSTPTSAP